MPIGTGLLDAVSATAESAWATERLLSSYSGDCIRAHDASDKSGSSQDIGFDANGDLDTSALESFAGSGDAWMEPFDQTDGSVITSSAPPKIVSSGTTITNSDGRPAPQFTGSQIIQMGSAPSTEYTHVQKADGGGSGSVAGLSSFNRLKNAGGEYIYQRRTGGQGKTVEASISGIKETIVVYSDITTEVTIWEDASIAQSFVPDQNFIGTEPLSIGNLADQSSPWGGTIEYAICWQSELSFQDLRALALNRGMI
jgi:hypothetical protein